MRDTLPEVIAHVAALLDQHGPSPLTDVGDRSEAPPLPSGARGVYRCLRQTCGVTPAVARVILAEALMGELAERHPEQRIVSPGLAALCRAPRATLYALIARAAGLVELLEREDGPSGPTAVH
jgi:hypothetical protein